MTFKQWKRRCDACGFKGLLFGWSHQMPLTCPECGQPTVDAEDRPNHSHGIIPDEIPGGLDVPHAICNPDGTPRRYYSKSEIRREAARRGWTIMGETPKVHREF